MKALLLRRGSIFICLALACIGLAADSFAAKTWDGGASTTKWSDANNWSPDGVPGATDDVTLDNSSVSGSYTVTMDTVSNNCKTLKIGYSGNTNTITFQLVGTASATTIITIAGDGTTADDFVVDEGGRFEFVPISTGGTTFVNTATGNSSRIKNNGYFYYNTARSYSTPFPAPGSNGGTTYEANSTIEVVAGVTNLTLSNRTWGNVIYSGTGTLSNSASTNTVYQGTVTIGSGVNLQPTYTGAGTITFQGNIINNGTVTITCAAANSVIFSGTNTLSGSPVTPMVIAGAGSGTIPSGSSLTVNSALNTNSTGAFNVAGTLQGGSATIGGTGSVSVASGATLGVMGSSRVDLQACKLEYSIVSPK